MALSERQKKGITYLVTAGLFALGGGALLAFTTTPQWVSIALDAIAAVAALVGIVVTAKPEV